MVFDSNNGGRSGGAIYGDSCTITFDVNNKSITF